jgi:hypothetical protein
MKAAPRFNPLLGMAAASQSSVTPSFMNGRPYKLMVLRLPAAMEQF